MCYLGFMASTLKPPTARVCGWGATGYLGASRRFLTSAQDAEVRRKRADLDAKLRQLTSAERDRRRWGLPILEIWASPLSCTFLHLGIPPEQRVERHDPRSAKNVATAQTPPMVERLRLRRRRGAFSAGGGVANSRALVAFEGLGTISGSSRASLGAWTRRPACFE